MHITHKLNTKGGRRIGRGRGRGIRGGGGGGGGRGRRRGRVCRGVHYVSLNTVDNYVGKTCSGTSDD